MATIKDDDLTPAGLWLKRNMTNIKVLFVLIVLLFGGWYVRQHPALMAEIQAVFAPPKEQASAVPPKESVGASGGRVLSIQSQPPRIPPKDAFTAQPSLSASTQFVEAETVDIAMLSWNAGIGFGHANGGVETVPGSIMARYGGKVRLIRQDDYEVMKTWLLAYAQAYASGKPIPSEGAVPAVIIMGNGAPAFVNSVNTLLSRLNGNGHDFTVRIVGNCGWSNGEDACMGTVLMRDQPQKPYDHNAKENSLRGSLFAWYPADGDEDVCLKLAGDLEIPVNTNENTFDIAAINMVSARDFVDAGQKYISNFSVLREEVENGVSTGRGQVKVHVNGVGTWTPEDSVIADQRGGLVKLASTRQYSQLMPATLIVINQWASDHRNMVESILAAAAEGGDEVNDPSKPDALLHGATVLNAVFAQDNTGPQYWADNYKGTTVKDKQGIWVDIGGSHANGLAESLDSFGLLPGSINVVGDVYTERGRVMSLFHPDLVPPNFPPADQVIDTSYMKGVYANARKINSVVTPRILTFTPGPITRVLGDKQWHIGFQTNSAVLTTAGHATISEIAKSAEMAPNLKIELYGFTDHTGPDKVNIPLSEKRALAVKAELMKLSQEYFPENRFVKVVGNGSSHPIGDNSTSAGQALNRRVEVKMGE